jgi:predicted O-linked N-acetylglucosamine transferase (SPINDLY family)
MYTKMGFRELVVDSPARFVATCQRLANDPDYRKHVRRRIQEASGALFDDAREIAGLEDFLWSLTQPR